VITRYWIRGENFCCAEGELSKYNDFVFYDFNGEKNSVLEGHHFPSKQEAFKSYCGIVEEKIEALKNKIELVRAQL
jgi:hypothetical protein